MEPNESLLSSASAKLSDRVFALDRKPRRLEAVGPLFSTVAGTKALEILLFDNKTHPYWTKLEVLGNFLRRHAAVLFELIKDTPPPASLLPLGIQPFSKKGRWIQARAEEVLSVLESVSCCEAFLVSESLNRRKEVAEFLGGFADSPERSPCPCFLLGVQSLLEVDAAWNRHVQEWKKKALRENSRSALFTERDVVLPYVALSAARC